jgi:hypothetical protein
MALPPTSSKYLSRAAVVTPGGWNEGSAARCTAALTPGSALA